VTPGSVTRARRAGKVVTALPALLLLAGCAAFEPSQDYPLLPPPEYRLWYMEVETCAPVRGNYDDLRFYYLPKDDTYAGRTFGQTIYLRASDSESRLVVEHEMLHSLIDDGGHTDPRWVACGLSPAQLGGR
jgi:hypothetical protein